MLAACAPLKALSTFRGDSRNLLDDPLFHRLAIQHVVFSSPFCLGHLCSDMFDLNGCRRDCLCSCGRLDVRFRRRYLRTCRWRVPCHILECWCVRCVFAFSFLILSRFFFQTDRVQLNHRDFISGSDFIVCLKCFDGSLSKIFPRSNGYYWLSLGV